LCADIMRPTEFSMMKVSRHLPDWIIERMYADTSSLHF
jgi:hypothetical protein